MVRGSGDRAVAAAAERAKHTSDRNVPSLSGLPVPEDTANLRLGPNLNDELLALIPLVGVWRGEGEADNAELGSHHFGQQIVISHDGGNYLVWESRSWLLDESGEYVRPTLRESGYWRISDDDVIEFVVTHSSGVVELFYGAPLSQSSWEIATDVVIRTATGPQYGGAKRLYGIVEGGDLAYVEERIQGDGEMRPHLSARLQRYVG
ncbi:FABP family protein [Rhodococcus sp. D2-41]|uniref:Peroxynitrite isomerase n=1 Tax=Speluncibacter jeojiensis TaxID=2710754 RepID=A0A9X4LZ53_9ACTN|nr:FABP family protein [Rhodococcus sp. D2-41]MDG3011600.1 FABP family protein [Rhodococcus sp. D2-41]MDG3015043.1 FABP family protein [Corynebacteriales bacterium D3-21]